MTYARDHRRAIKKVREKVQKRVPLKKWEQKRLEHDQEPVQLPPKK